MHKSSDKLKRIRAMELINRTVLKGETIKSVAGEMGISEDTAQRTLKWAGEANLFKQYEQRLYGELLPLAHEAIKLALQDGDAQVALKIMEAAGLGPNRLKGNSKAAQDYEEGLYGELARQRGQWAIGDDGDEPRLVGIGRLSTIDTTGDSLDDVPLGDGERGVDGDAEDPQAEGPSGVEDVARAAKEH